MRITHIRTLYSPDGTLGKWILNGETLCYTLERPDNGNNPDDKKTAKNDSGCIPEGIYKVKKDYTGKFQYFSILNVPNRTAIECHQANVISELLGCIALGERITRDVTYRGVTHKFFLNNSKRTCDRLKKELPEEFELEITSHKSLCSVEF